MNPKPQKYDVLTLIQLWQRSRRYLGSYRIENWLPDLDCFALMSLSASSKHAQYNNLDRKNERQRKGADSGPERNCEIRISESVGQKG